MSGQMPEGYTVQIRGFQYHHMYDFGVSLTKTGTNAPQLPFMLMISILEISGLTQQIRVPGQLALDAKAHKQLKT